MMSCYNVAPNQRVPAQQQIYQQPSIAPASWFNGGALGLGQVGGTQGANGATMGGVNLQLARLPPPTMAVNNGTVSTPELGTTRFPRMFNSGYPSFGTTKTSSTTSSSCGATPSPPPIMQSLIPPGFDSTLQLSLAASNNVFSGVGTIVWMTPEKGIIENIAENGENGGESAGNVCGAKSPRRSSDDNNNCDSAKNASSKPQSPRNVVNNLQIAFGIKQLCDQAVADLTSVLRIGFVVKYHATLDMSAYSHGNFGQHRLIATFVSPIPLTDWTNATPAVQAAAKKLSTLLDTPAAEPLPCEDASKRKNVYDLQLELRATELLMNIYREQSSEGPQCPLSTVHCIVSNCRDDQMYRYIGTSSLKRRQFVERRKHFFALAHDDTVCLVPAAVHTAVSSMAKELLQRGGAMKLQELFNQYSNWADLPLDARELVGESKRKFIQFLEAHPFVFNIFPSRVFVSLQHPLPNFDYGSFLEECFGDQEGSPYFAQCQTTTPDTNVPTGGFGQVGNQPPSASHNRVYWGRVEEQRPSFGGNGRIGPQSGPPDRQLVSPPAFQQPTPPGYPHSAGPRFGAQNSYNFTVPPPPLGVARYNAALNAPHWPPPSQMTHSSSNVDEAKPPCALPGSVSGSSLSMSSGYSTGPTPSTPGVNHAQFWPSSAGAFGQGAAPAPENVAGFWKSYELGTETLIRQLHLSNNDPRFGSVTSPSPHESVIALAERGFGSRMTTPDNLCARPLSSASSVKGITSDNVAQTEQYVVVLKCGNCGFGNEWACPTRGTEDAGAVVKPKPETTDASIQTESVSDGPGVKR